MLLDLITDCSNLSRFPCSRWLSRNQDDGSTERLLIADIIRASPLEDGK